MVSSQTECEVCVLEDLRAADLWKASQKLGFPSAIWKLPHTAEVKLLISVQGGVSSVSPDLEKMPSGFILGPFGFEEHDQVLFMEGDIIEPSVVHAKITLCRLCYGFHLFLKSQHLYLLVRLLSHE